MLHTINSSLKWKYSQRNEQSMVYSPAGRIMQSLARRAVNLASLATNQSTVKMSFVNLEIQLQVAISPEHLHKPFEAIAKQLNTLLFRYNDDFQGIPISYSKCKLPKTKSYGRVIGEMPWIHYDVDTKLLIFKPIIGSIIKGKICKATETHLSLLVHGMFNASISGDNVAAKYSFNNSTATWESALGDAMIAEGDFIDFCIMSVQHNAGVLCLIGSLVE